MATVEAASTSLVVRELVLVDENNKPAASLTSQKGRTVLAFFNAADKRQVELGFDQKSDEGFLYLLEKGGQRVNAALTSAPPHSEGTLALGDDFWQGKVVLGALRTDVVDPDARGDHDDWGLELHRSGNPYPDISLLAPPRASGSSVGISLRRANGTYWAAP
jgi:hypothetical protein